MKRSGVLEHTTVQRTKQQHYVPQFYLRAFAGEDGFIHAYDKLQDKAFKANTPNIAGETAFYDLELPGDSKFDHQIVEKQLSRLETRFADLTRTILERIGSIPRSSPNKHLDVLTQNLKEEFSYHLAIQLLRTKESRVQMRQLREGLASSIHQMGWRYECDAFRVGDRGVEYHTELEPVFQAEQMFDPEFCEPIRAVLASHIWVFGKIDGSSRLYTSDHPIVRFSHGKHEWMSCTGIGSPGIELAFPLTPTHILVMFERSHFEHIQRCDRKLMDLGDDQVEYYNAQQVVVSNRQIYSADGNFKLAREVCASLPELRQAQRRRIISN